MPTGHVRNPVLYTLVLLGALAGCGGSHPRKGASFPEYSTVEGREPCVTDVDMERLSAAEERVDEELRARRPARTAPTFLLIYSDDGVLTWNGGTCLLAFSSGLRANHYGAMLDRDAVAVPISVLSAAELFDEREALRQAGVTGITIDKCFSCEQATVVSLEALRDPEELLDLWEIYSSTRILMADDMMHQAAERFAEGQYAQARAIALDVVECVDVDRPDAHLLIGKCGVELGDDGCVREARDFLSMFDGEWLGRLEGWRPHASAGES